MCTLLDEMTATPGTKSWKHHMENECTCTETCDALVNLQLKWLFLAQWGPKFISLTVLPVPAHTRSLIVCCCDCLSRNTHYFSSTAFTPRKTHAVFSDLYSNRRLNKVLVKATGTALPKQSIDLQKNSTIRPLSAASFSFLLTLTHPRMFHTLDGR